MISKDNQYLLQLISDALHDDNPELGAPNDWEAVQTELGQQALTGLIAGKLSKLKLGQEDLLPYMQKIGKTIRYFFTIMEEQTTVFSLLEKANIPAVVLKGAAAAMNYPRPEYRSMGDIDIIVPTDKFEQAYNVLKNSGYKPEQSIEEYKRHVGFRGQSGIEIELHYHFSSGRNIKFNKVLDSIIYTGIDKCERIDVCGYE